MADTDQSALMDDPDPDEDTPDTADEEGAEDEVQPEPDTDSRLSEAQATITRQAQELALFRRGTETEGDGQDGEEAGNDDPYQSRLENESWVLAQNIYGEDAIEAYRAAADLIERAVTPADHLAAFEAYHAIRSGEGVATDATDGSGRPTRAEALTPRVDANRSDLGPDLQSAEQQLVEARKGNSLENFAAAATARMGFGRAK